MRKVEVAFFIAEKQEPKMKANIHKIKQIYITIFILSLYILGAQKVYSFYNPATGREEAEFYTKQDEQQIGYYSLQQFLRNKRISNNPVYARRVDRILRKLVTSISSRGMIYNYVVIEGPINAAAFPGGYILVTTSLLNNVKDEELAAVLAHEVGHVEARHGMKGIEAQAGYNLIINVAYLLDGRKPNKKNPEWRDIVNATNQIYNFVDKGYSRADEYEADHLSIRYMRNAGYDPKAILSTLEMLKRKTYDFQWNYFQRSHPFLDERIQAARNEIGKMPSYAIKKGDTYDNFEAQGEIVKGVIISEPEGAEVQVFNTYNGSQWLIGTTPCVYRIERKVLDNIFFKIIKDGYREELIRLPSNDVDKDIRIKLQRGDEYWKHYFSNLFIKWKGSIQYYIEKVTHRDKVQGGDKIGTVCKKCGRVSMYNRHFAETSRRMICRFCVSYQDMEWAIRRYSDREDIRRSLQKGKGHWKYYFEDLFYQWKVDIQQYIHKCMENFGQ